MTETDAIERVVRALECWLASAKVVTVNVADTGSESPWLASFACSADDPDFDEFAEELKRIRCAANSE